MSQQTLNLVNNIVINAEERGVAKLVLENVNYDGKNVLHNGQELISFGSYSYLGLEVDSRLKEAAISAINDYGIQYPSSRIYSSLPIYANLNKLIERIFDSNIVLTTSLSLGHIGVMPIAISSNDLLILDQHVHSSVQDAAQRVRSKGTDVKIVRHNDMEALEAKIREFSNSYDKIWYAIDGIYSMYGDTAPIEEIEILMNKYKNFYVYADDAHGISSFGPNGAGWILSKINLHPKMILTTGMAKAFGTMGGIFVIPDFEMYSKIKNCTGSLIFSGPHPIPIIGASVKSAEIHLTPEIYERQTILHEKIKYCHELLLEKGIPNISDKETPIFFIAIGKLNGGYNLVKKMLDSGFLTNLASFPAVSESCTGLRFTITYHHTFEDIRQLVCAFVQNYPEVLVEEDLYVDKVRKAFRKVKNFPSYVIGQNKTNETTSLRVVQAATISKLDCNIWDKTFNSGELFNSNTLSILEETFRNNENKFHNWNFKYFQIFDENDILILSTFFTISISKEDMISPKHVSELIETKRIDDPEYLTSKVILMGTQITEGNHLYINVNSKKWKYALALLIEQIDKIKEALKINTILFRDFDVMDVQLSEALKGYGFLKIQLPDSHIIFNREWQGPELFGRNLNRKRRKYINQKVLQNENNFKITIEQQPSIELIEKCHKLYGNVNDKSLELNTFELPQSMFSKLLENADWEIITLKLKLDCTEPIVAMILAFKGNNSYHPMLAGIDYNYLDHNIYPQTLWQVVKRSNELDLSRLYFGFTASQNKRKFGADRIEKYAFVKSTDNYSQIVLNHV